MKNNFILDDMESMKKKKFKENVEENYSSIFPTTFFFYKINEEKKSKLFCT